MFISRFFWEHFCSYLSFGIMQNSKLYRSCPISVAGAQTIVVYVYTAARLCFIKEINPTFLSSLSDTNIQQTNWFTYLLHTHKKTCSPILHIIGVSFLKQKNNAVQKPSYYKVLDQQSYLNHSRYDVLYILNFPLPTPWFINNDTFW